MFFYTKVNNIDTRIDVSHYDNGSTCVTALIDDTIYELSSPAILQNKYDFQTFVTQNDLKEFNIKCLKKLPDLTTLTGNKFQKYGIDFNETTIFSPSEYVQQLMEQYKLNKANTHKALKISHMTLHRIINQDDNITIPMALKLGKFFNVDPNSFIELQQNFDLIKALLNPDFTTSLNEIQTLKES